MRVSEDTKIELDKVKVHPRESYDEVIMRLVRDSNPVYDKDFKEWLLDNMKRNHPDIGAMHIDSCEPGLQVFCDKNPIILIPHGELKMLKCLMDEGYEFGAKGHSLGDYQIFQNIDGKIR